MFCTFQNKRHVASLGRGLNRIQKIEKKIPFLSSVGLNFMNDMCGFLRSSVSHRFLESENEDRAKFLCISSRFSPTIRGISKKIRGLQRFIVPC